MSEGVDAGKDAKKARIALVAAVARNGAIGVRGGLAWRIADDLKWFKSVTIGKPVIMGRKTFDSIGKPLPGRDNIIVTRRAGFSVTGAIVANSVGDALSLAFECARRAGVQEICIIGGGDIYTQTIDLSDRIYLTRVDADVEGDAFFPKINLEQWRERRESSCSINERNEFRCEFFILDRIG